VPVLVENPTEVEETGEGHRKEFAEQLAAAQAAVDAFGDRSVLWAGPSREQIRAASDAVAIAGTVPQLREQLAQLDVEDEAALRRLEAALGDATAKLGRATAQSKAIEEDLAADLTAAAAAVEQARARRDEADVLYGAAQLSLADAREEAGDVAGAEEKYRFATGKRQEFERVLRDADQAVSSARARVDHLRSRQDALADLRLAVQVAEMQVGDWNLLERSLGKDGVQALEIDAAAPEVSTIANELLASCYGPRFSITFETLRAKRDGGQAESFEIRVYDGAEARPVEALSGGEKVVVGEAIGLALAILNARKNAIRFETFFRDETAGALDPENAAAYIAMLRRARELAGAHQIVFIAHQEELWRAADARLFVEDGHVYTENEERAAA
jgi:exonuclease SbcC